jgi:outer membrane protein W
MKISSVARKVTAIVVGVAAMAGGMSSAHAQSSIFPAGFDSKVRDRLFMRLGYIQTFTKTKSEEARDITGPVVSRQDFLNAFQNTGNAISVTCFQEYPNFTTYSEAECTKLSSYDTDPADPNSVSFFYKNAAPSIITTALDNLGIQGIGTPAGIKARAQRSVGTPAISVGYWLDDDYKWLVEAYVLAAPLKIKIYGDGVRDDGTPNGINGRHIATTKLLPPLVIASYNFGERRSVIRPYVGVGAMYAIFFDAKTTSFFDEYQGGKTTLTTKNTFGFGPFVGIQSPIGDDWHVNISVGQVALRTTSTLVTSGTQIGASSAVLRDLPAAIRQAIVDGNTYWQGDPALGYLAKASDFTDVTMDLVKRSKNQQDLGTFVREQKMKITNTIVSLSVGRSF